MANDFIRRLIDCQGFASLLRCSSTFTADKRGSVAVVFMLSMLPIMTLAAAAVDMSMMSRIKTRTQLAADMAALASVTENYLDYKKSMEGNVEKARLAAVREFEAQSQILNVTNPETTVTVKSTLASSDQVQVQVCFEGEHPTTMLSILTIKSIPFSGCSEAVSAKPYYVNVYILVDASGSMGIGANASDRATMRKLYKDWKNADKPFPMSNVASWGSCEFYCHTVSPNPQDQNQLDGQPHLNAPENRVLFKTRFDIFKQALSLALDGAKQNAKFSDQFKFNVFKFSNYLTEVAPLSADIDFVKSKVNAMEQDREGAGTNYTYSMNNFASYIPKNGDGSSADKAKAIVMVLSDGLESHVYEQRNCDLAVKYSKYISSCKKEGNYYHGRWEADQNITYRNTPAHSSYAWAMDDQSCKAIRETDAAILVLAAEVYEGSWASTGNENLRKCATEMRYAFTANSSDDVNKAINQMFGFVMSMPRFSYGGFANQ